MDNYKKPPGWGGGKGQAGSPVAEEACVCAGLTFLSLAHAKRSVRLFSSESLGLHG